MTAYAATKSRVRNALFAATGKSYGVRKEWRVSWWQWSVFDPLPMGFENQFHGPYWVLPMSVVLNYIRWDTNRWLFPVEVMIDLIRDRMANPALRVEEEQLSNSVIVSCMLRCAGASINGRCLKLKSSLWDYEYEVDHRTTRGLVCESTARCGCPLVFLFGSLLRLVHMPLSAWRLSTMRSAKSLANGKS